MKSFFRIIFPLLVSLLIGWWAYQKSITDSSSFNIDNFLENLSMAKIATAMGLTYLVLLVRSLRISTLFFYYHRQFKNALLVNFFSIPFSFLLGGMGLLIRLVALRKKTHYPYTISIGFIATEKLFDLIFAFSIIFFLFEIEGGNSSWIFATLKTYRLYFLIAFILILVVLFIYRRPAINGLLLLLQFLPDRIYQFIKKRLASLSHSFDLIGVQGLLHFTLLTLVVFAVESWFYYYVLKSLNIALGFEDALLISSTLLFALLIPLFPSGIGVLQAVIVFVGTGLGLQENLFYPSVLLHAILIIAHLLVLIVGTYWLSKSVMDVFFKKKAIE